MYKGKLTGGMARLATVIADMKKASKNVVVVDAGDIFQGSPLYSRYLGEVEVNLLNMAGYDVYTLGNHEFDNGASNTARQMKNARFDIINCNLDMKKVPALDQLVKPYVVKEFGKQKVAFVGAITPELELLSSSLEGARLKAKGDNWIEPIKNQVDELTKTGFDKIVLVSHCGLDQEKKLARAIPKVDAIIGGHSHTRLDKRVIVDHDDGTTTTIVQTGCYGRALGKLDLVFDKEGLVDVKASRYRLYDIHEKIAEVPSIKAYVEKKMVPLLTLRQKMVGFASQEFGPKITPSDSPMGDLICDALIESGKEYGATLALHNRGGTRGVLEKGPISLADVEQILPFDNYLVFATITGTTLNHALEHAVGGSIGGRFLDVGGIKFAYDKSKSRGKRLIFVRIKNKDGSWSPISKEKKYKIIMNHYNFEGGEGYDFKDAQNVVKTKTRIAESLNNYLLKHQKVTPQKPNRIVCVTSDLLHVDGGHKLKSPVLVLQGVSPGARLSLVSGSAPGVSTIFNAFPVPVENARVLQSSLKADRTGSFEWNKLDTALLNEDRHWLCVVAYPPKKSAGRAQRKTIIAGPVNISHK